MGRRVAVFLWLLVGCDEGSGDSGGFETTTTPATKGSGGFSSDLAKKIGSGSGATVAVANDPKPGDPKAGDPKAVDAKAGSNAGSGADAGGSGANAGSDAKAGDPKAGDPKAGDPKAGDPKAGSAAKIDPKVDPKAGSAAVDPKAGDPKAGSASKPAISGPPPIDASKPRVYVKPSAEVGAIKLSLLPNWDRDVGEAGTISLVVKVQGTDQTRVFAFRYGYEDPKAPMDREAYKKWLAERNILKAPAGGAIVDRQRGGSWYLEGVDGSGAPVFRNIVVFSGRKLICGGSLYKDPTSNQLGDIRDKTIIQAKEICQELGL